MLSEIRWCLSLKFICELWSWGWSRTKFFDCVRFYSLVPRPGNRKTGSYQSKTSLDAAFLSNWKRVVMTENKMLKNLRKFGDEHRSFCPENYWQRCRITFWRESQRRTDAKTLSRCSSNKVFGTSSVEDVYWSLVEGTVVRGAPWEPVALATKLGCFLSGPTMVMVDDENGDSVNLTARHVLKVESTVTQHEVLMSELRRLIIYKNNLLIYIALFTFADQQRFTGIMEKNY